jgi:hypothetical protein
MMQLHRNSAISYFFSSLEDTILENPVRFIDAFVEALALQTLGFSVQTIKGKVASFNSKCFSNLFVWLSQRNQSGQDLERNVLETLKCNGF